MQVADLQVARTARDRAEYVRAEIFGQDGAVKTISRRLEESVHDCGGFEWVTLAYVGWLNAIVLLCHRNIPDASLYFLAHAAITVGILVVVRYGARSRSEAVRFARHWYPLPLYIFFFEELQGLVHAIFPGWFDHWLITFDYTLAGTHPSVWLARFSSPALNDYMQFAYAQHERAAFWTVMVSTAIANYSIYVIAILFPIESPYYSLAALHIDRLPGGYCTALIELIERFARVHGAAFPSAHVAGSMVALLASWRYRRWLFWVCLPFFASMCVATVYGRYHYMADVFAGLIVGGLGFSAGTRLERNRESAEINEMPAERILQADTICAAPEAESA
jgi:membrane-associated phospholipid phosphatase